MTQPPRFIPEAAAELEDAAGWYEQEGSGLGIAFLAAIDETIELVARWPDAGTPVSGLPADLPVRRVPIPRFPYFVAYLASANAVQILAVAHERRRPAYWSGRVDR